MVVVVAHPAGKNLKHQMALEVVEHSDVPEAKTTPVVGRCQGERKRCLGHLIRLPEELPAKCVLDVSLNTKTKKLGGSP